MKKYALVSLSNKENLNFLCSILQKNNISILSTKSTGQAIREIGFKCQSISKLLSFNEIMDGRVKTLHPKIYASILHDRKNKIHLKDFKKLNFPSIDFVIVSFYTLKKLNKNKTDFIDIGGPSLLRSAAKNFKYVTAISDINDYKLLNNNLKKNNGHTSLSFRKKMAGKVFKKTSEYDASISKSINLNHTNDFLISHKYKQLLKYGENYHQKSFFYSNETKNTFLKGVIQGKEITYNNVLDLDSAYKCINDFKIPTCAIIKHNNPCGVASNRNMNKAFILAKKCDPISSFGGVIAFNRSVNEKLAKNIIKDFYQIVLAPNFTIKALKIFEAKNNLLIIKSKNFKEKDNMEVKSANNGYLVQEKNNVNIGIKDIKLVSNIKANKNKINDLLFALKVCKHVKSNAIVLVKNNATLGIGAGQMSRIDSTKLAINKIGNKNNSFVAASDAFFPFLDNIQILVKKNCNAIIQPSGSINDKKIIKYANKKKIPLYFSKYRFFRH